MSEPTYKITYDLPAMEYVVTINNEERGRFYWIGLARKFAATLGATQLGGL